MAFRVIGDGPSPLRIDRTGPVSGGVDQQFFDQAAQKPVPVFEQQPFQFGESPDSATVFESSGGVDGLPFVVAGPPLAGGVKVLEGKSQGIDVTVARRTPFVGSMPGELFTDSRGSPCVGFQFCNAGRRGIGRVAQQVAQYLDAPDHGRGDRAI